jgi:hypothetical protein
VLHGVDRGDPGEGVHDALQLDRGRPPVVLVVVEPAVRPVEERRDQQFHGHRRHLTDLVADILLEQQRQAAARLDHGERMARLVRERCLIAVRAGGTHEDVRLPAVREGRTGRAAPLARPSAQVEQPSPRQGAEVFAERGVEAG